MARSRLPFLRRMSQIFFLLLFLVLLAFTTLRPTPGATADLHLRLPVRLFFEWDPLVAVANALASHALYRGLLWSLMILLPTLFLGRFFCGWICPMGTLQHFVGNMPSEAKRGKQRIESNRYKRWQTAKYVVLIAGLVAACFGSMAIGWLDPFSLLVRSIGLSTVAGIQLCGARGAGCRWSTATWRRFEATGETLHKILQATVLDFRQAHFAQGLVLGIVFLLILAASLRVTRLWCRCDLPAGGAAGRGFAVVDSGTAQGCGGVRQMQSLPAELPGRRRPHRRRAVAQGRVPDVHELRGELSARQSQVPVLPQRARSGFAGYRAAQGTDRAGGGSCGGAADARQHGAGQEPQRAAAASAGRAGRRRIFFRAASAAASA